MGVIMSGQPNVDSSINVAGAGSVPSSTHVDSSYINVANNIDSSIDAQYQSALYTPAQTTTTPAASVSTTTDATYTSSLDVTASTGTENREVTTFIEPDNAYILSIIQDLGINEDMAEEMRMELIMNLLANNFGYEADSAGEAWNSVETTLSTMSGDCEDLCNLAASLLIAAGFSPEDVNVYVDLAEDGGQGHTTIGLTINGEEVELDVAQIIEDSDGSYVQIDTAFINNNQLDPSQYDFSYSTTGIKQLNTSISGDVVMEDATDADSYYTATAPAALPPFMSRSGNSVVINGTDGDDTINLYKNTDNQVILEYNGTTYNLTADYGIENTASFRINEGQGNDSTTHTGVSATIGTTIAKPTHIITQSGSTITINGSGENPEIDLETDIYGHIILTHNGSRYDLTNLYGDNLTINISSSGNINIEDVAVNTILTGAGNDEVTLSGSASANTILTGSGSDQVSLRDDATVGTINTGAGNDEITLSGDSSATTVQGQAGYDHMSLSGNSDVGTVDGGEDADTLNIGGNASVTTTVADSSDSVVSTRGNASTSSVDYETQLTAAFETGGANALMQEAFSIAVDNVVAVAPPGSTKYEQMLYSMANTIEALFDTLLIMSDYMAQHSETFQDPGALFELQQSIQQVKDTISTLTAVGQLGTDIVSDHLSQFVKELNS